MASKKIAKKKNVLNHCEDKSEVIKIIGDVNRKLCNHESKIAISMSHKCELGNATAKVRMTLITIIMQTNVLNRCKTSHTFSRFQLPLPISRTRQSGDKIAAKNGSKKKQSVPAAKDSTGPSIAENNTWKCSTKVDSRNAAFEAKLQNVVKQKCTPISVKLFKCLI